MLILLTRRACIRAVGLLVMICMTLCLLADSAHAYNRRFIWKSKERKEIKKLTKLVKTDDKGFNVLETEHWHIKTQLSAKFTAEAAVYMELFYDVFNKAVNFKSESKVDLKPTLVVFDSQANYMAVPGNIKGSRGIFMSGWQGDKVSMMNLYTYCVPKHGAKEALFEYAYHPVIKHEAVHCLLQAKFGAKRIPVWLNEGCASFYEHWDLRAKISESGNSSKDKKARHERLVRSTGQRTLRKYVMGKRDFPRLDYVVKLNKKDNSWNGGAAGGISDLCSVHYSMSESLADALISSKEGRKIITNIFKRVDSGAKEVITADEVTKFEVKWYEYLEKGWGITMPVDTRKYYKKQRKIAKKIKLGDK